MCLIGQLHKKLGIHLFLKFAYHQFRQEVSYLKKQATAVRWLSCYIAKNSCFIVKLRRRSQNSLHISLEHLLSFCGAILRQYNINFTISFNQNHSTTPLSSADLYFDWWKEKQTFEIFIVVQSYDGNIHSINVNVLGYICSYTSKSGQQNFHFPCWRLKPTNFAVSSLQKCSPKNMCCIIAGLIPLKQAN